MIDYDKLSKKDKEFLESMEDSPLYCFAVTEVEMNPVKDEEL